MKALLHEIAAKSMRGYMRLMAACSCCCGSQLLMDFLLSILAGVGPQLCTFAGNLNDASRHLACIPFCTTSCSALGNRLRGYSPARAAARLAGMHLNRHAVFGACVISRLGVAGTGIGTDYL